MASYENSYDPPPVDQWKMRHTKCPVCEKDEKWYMITPSRYVCRECMLKFDDVDGYLDPVVLQARPRGPADYAKSPKDTRAAAYEAFVEEKKQERMRILEKQERERMERIRIAEEKERVRREKGMHKLRMRSRRGKLHED